MVLLCEYSCQNGRLWLMCFVFVRAVGKLSILHSSQGSSISSPSLRAHSFSQELYCLFIGEWRGRSRSGIKASALWFGALSPHLNVSPRNSRTESDSCSWFLCACTGACLLSTCKRIMYSRLWGLVCFSGETFQCFSGGIVISMERQERAQTYLLFLVWSSPLPSMDFPSS